LKKGEGGEEKGDRWFEECATVITNSREIFFSSIVFFFLAQQESFLVILKMWMNKTRMIK